MDQEKALCLQIERLTFRGDGIGRDPAGEIWRVAGTMPGDVVQAIPIPTFRGNRAHLVHIVEPGPDRVPSGCPQATFCRGCQLRCMALDQQRTHITRQWRATFRRVTGLSHAQVDAAILEPTARVAQAYRSRALARVVHTVDGPDLVMRAADSQGTQPEWVELCRCPSHHPAVERLLIGVRDCLRRHPADIVQVLVTAHPRRSGVAWTRVQLAGPRIPRALSCDVHETLCCSVLVADCPADGFGAVDGPWTTLFGVPTIGLECAAGVITGPVDAWLPTGFDAAHAIEAAVLRAIPDGIQRIIEIGCGVGTHSFAFAARAQQVIGVDVSRAAIGAARANALALGVDNVTFRVSKGHTALRQFLKKGPRTADLIVLHGMRRPFGPRLCKLIPMFKPDAVVIVAPSAWAGAGDAATLCDAGFSVQRVELVHHMPHTYHAMGIVRVQSPTVR